MIYGYCRVSTTNQSIDRQTANVLRAYPDAVIYQESYTGTKVEGRREFNKLLRRVQAGDTIVFDAVDRMSRNAAEGVEVYMDLYNKGVNLVYLKNPTINSEVYRAALADAAAVPTVSTGDADLDELTSAVLAAVRKYQVKLITKQVVAAFDQAQAEVDHLHKRTSEGMAAAGATNVFNADGEILQQGSISKARTGMTYTTKKAANALEVIRQHSKAFGGSLEDAEVMKLAGVSRNSYYKYKRQVAEELAKEVEA